MSVFLLWERDKFSVRVAAYIFFSTSYFTLDPILNSKNPPESISEKLAFKIFLGEDPPDPPTRACFTRMHLRTQSVQLA